MGTMEQGAKKRRERENIQKTILSVVAVAGTLAIAAVAPNVLQALPSLMGKRRYKLAFQTHGATERLIVKGYLKRSGPAGNTHLELTASGTRFLALEEARVASPAKQRRRWDKRYRLVMFDIPQKRRLVRDRLRRLMGEFGFLRLQDSVWVSPYDCEDLIALVKTDLRLGSDVIYAVVEEIGNAKMIKTHFNLP